MCLTSLIDSGPDANVVAAPADITQAEPAASLVLALTDGLAATRSMFKGRSRYILSDPLRASHVAVTPDVWSLLSALDGQKALTQILIQLQKAGRPMPALSSLLATLARLRDAGLIRIVSGKIPIPEARKASQPIEARLVYFRRELVELIPVMPQANALLGWMFTRTGMILWAIMLTIALYQLASQWHRVDNVLQWLGQLSTTQALLLYSLTICIKAAHEVSHAVAYRRMAAAEGIAVSSIRAGISFMLFLPFPFTNCSGAWAISDKYRRAVIGMAGMYAETWIAIMALLLWSVTSDPLIASICLQVATVVGISTLLFNLNPLAKLDGYYVMTDTLERPNLQTQAVQAGMLYLQRLLKIQSSDAQSSRPDTGLLIYWLASGLYRWVIFTGMIWLAFHVSVWLAIPVATVAVSLLIYRPLSLHINMLMAYSENKKETRRKLIKIAVAGFILLCVLPLPAGKRAVAVAEMDGSAFVYAPRDARITHVAHAGTAGEVLTLDNPELPLMRQEMLARRALAAVRYQKALETTAENPRSVEAARAVAEEIAGLDRQLEKMDSEMTLLSTTSETADRWDPLRTADLYGSWVTGSRQQPLGMLAARAPVRVRALIAEQEQHAVKAGQEVQIRLGNYAVFQGRVARIDSSASSTLPSRALGKNAGGSITLNPDDMTGLTALSRYVSVWIDVTNKDMRASLHHGQILDVRFTSGLRPIVWQLATTVPMIVRRHAETTSS